MSKEAFEEHQEKEGWSDADDNSSNDVSESLSFGRQTVRVQTYFSSIYCAFHSGK